MKMMKKQRVRRDTKRVFFKKGTCSRTFFYLLNREFGHPLEDEERAADPLAGGILQQGYQCGMVWGASFALGAEALRRFPDPHRATGVAIKATRHVMDSFIKTNRANSIACGDIADCDWSNKWKFAKYMLSGRFWYCFKLAEQWAPEAFEAAEKGLSLDPTDLPKKPMSCASELVRRMGGTEAEAVMAAGLAGGIGLSGDGCGALGAAVWMNTLERVRKGDWKYSMSDPVLEDVLKTFYEASEYEMECRVITGKRFETVTEHTEFIRSGGCEKLIATLAAI
jgi:hypothetical protein